MYLTVLVFCHLQEFKTVEIVVSDVCDTSRLSEFVMRLVDYIVKLAKNHPYKGIVI